VSLTKAAQFPSQAELCDGARAKFLEPFEVLVDQFELVSIDLHAAFRRAPKSQQHLFTERIHCMPLPTDPKALALSREALQAFDNVNGGEHPGFRPAHAKGIMFSGVFRPSPEATSLTRAPHAQKQIPITVRLSDFAGIPNIPDNSPEGASPRGCAIRFHLGEHVHTDIVAHSVDSFPARTAEEFVEFLHAVAASDPSKPHPNAVEQFLGTHPKALAFVQAPKPIPTSFAHESFFAVSAFKFTAADGNSRFGRYRIIPDAGNEYLDAAGAAAKGPNFLFDDIKQRITKGPINFHIIVQLAEPDDVTDDATVRWPEERSHLKFGEIVLQKLASDADVEKRRIIFDPIPRVDGIEPSADPLFQPRADLYLLSGRRRRAADHEANKAKAS
jgi:catalase